MFSSFESKDSDDSSSIDESVLMALLSSDESFINQEVSVSQVVKKKKKKKKKKKCGRRPSFRPHLIPELRILRDDVRKGYPQMYANVLNSLDGELMRKFFSEVCCPHLVYERTYGSCAFSQMISTFVPKPLFGIHQYVSAVGAFVTSTIVSDLAVTLRNPKLIVTKGIPGSRIEMDNYLDITILYSMKRIPYHEKSVQIVQQQTFPSPGFEIIDPTTNDWICLSLLPTPIRMRVDQPLVLKLDEHHRIEAILLKHRDSIQYSHDL